MPQNTGFHSREPFRTHDALQLQHQHISGPLSFLNPTRAYFHYVTPRGSRGSLVDGLAKAADEDNASRENAPKLRDHGDLQPVSNIQFKWRSRDNRKGRHALVIEPAKRGSSSLFTPHVSATLRETLKGVRRMCTQLPYWDISYLVAVIFTLGSCVWVINAFLVWLPLVKPSTEFKNEILVGGGVSAFIGATVFEIGSVLLMLEAINENRQGCFGWALQKAFSATGEEGNTEVIPDQDTCSHHHTNRKNFIGKGSVNETPKDGHSSSSESNSPTSKSAKTCSVGDSWQWSPTLHDLTSHYLRELGFLASLAQFTGATIFWISGFTALPGINNKMSQGLLDGVYWAPQIIGGSGFIVSGSLYMLETQDAWYKPAYSVLGWHIGFWNLIGALGFTLCGALGPAYGNSGAEYEASLATFWGSWAFLIGSTIQWYESLDKHPVETKAQGQ